MKNLLLLLTVLFSSVAFAQNGEKNFIDQNYIEVVGKAEMEVTPDRIYIQIRLNEKDLKNKESLVEKESDMIKKLEEIGIDVSKDLLVKDISSSFKYYLITKNEILLSKEYQVLVRDSKIVSKILIEIEKVGISNISIERVENSKITEFRKEVKINAIKAAKEKAEYLANAVNQQIGRAIYIKEIDNNNGFITGASNTILIRGSSSLYGSKASTPDIEFEKIKLEYSILCKFELK